MKQANSSETCKLITSFLGEWFSNIDVIFHFYIVY